MKIRVGPVATGAELKGRRGACFRWWPGFYPFSFYYFWNVIPHPIFMKK
jgi:hypothetical protein